MAGGVSSMAVKCCPKLRIDINDSWAYRCPTTKLEYWIGNLRMPESSCISNIS
jgi:hypothetical protein